MTSFVAMEETDLSHSSEKPEQQYTDIESYRRLVFNLLQLRRYKSALFWAEKVTVLSNNYPKDVYQLAQCMFMLREYNRAAHVIKNSGLEKTNLLCLTLLVECLFDSKEYQEALNLLTSIEIEDLNSSLHNETESEALINLSNEPSKNVSKKQALGAVRMVNFSCFLSGHFIITLSAEGKDPRVDGHANSSHRLLHPSSAKVSLPHRSPRCSCEPWNADGLGGKRLNPAHHTSPATRQWSRPKDFEASLREQIEKILHCAEPGKTNFLFQTTLLTLHLNFRQITRKRHQTTLSSSTPSTKRSRRANFSRAESPSACLLRRQSKAWKPSELQQQQMWCRQPTKSSPSSRTRRHPRSRFNRVSREFHSSTQAELLMSAEWRQRAPSKTPTTCC